jgi:hypothetical protein
LEYHRIENLGRWASQKYPEILALTAQFDIKLAKYDSQAHQLTQALALYAPNAAVKPDPHNEKREKFGKPKSFRKANEPQVLDYKGHVWKYCTKCFTDKGGNWNLTHTFEEHKSKAPLIHDTTTTATSPTPSLSRTPTVAPAPSTAAPPTANVASFPYAVDFIQGCCS